MRTKKFIDIVMSRAAASITRVEALAYTNSVQNHILARATPLSRVQPDPILHTADSVFSYPASANIKDADGAAVGDVCLVRRVYRTTPGGPYNQDERLIDGDHGSEVEAAVGVIPSREPDSDDCKIIWPRAFNPKDTDDRWYCEAYLWPAQLDSEQIPLSVPAPEQLTLLLMGVLEQVEMQEYGRGGFPSEKFQAALMEFDSKYATTVVQSRIMTAGVIPYRAC